MVERKVCFEIDIPGDYRGKHRVFIHLKQLLNSRQIWGEDGWLGIIDSWLSTADSWSCAAIR